MALLFAIENSYQTALMAPTEILVQQHFRKFQEYLDSLRATGLQGVTMAILTGSTPGKLKKEIYAGLENGQIQIVVGTHALIQDEVRFSKLGLVSISPRSIEYADGKILFTTVPQYHPIEENMNNFYSLVKEISRVLNGSLPTPSANCKLCIYRNSFMNKPSVTEDTLPF